MQHLYIMKIHKVPNFSHRKKISFHQMDTSIVS